MAVINITCLKDALSSHQTRSRVNSFYIITSIINIIKERKTERKKVEEKLKKREK